MKTNITDNKAVIYLQGRIDSTNAPEKEMDIMNTLLFADFRLIDSTS